MIGALVASFAVFFRSRLDLSLEVLALRQQLVVLKRKRRRPVLSRLDRLFWIMLRSVWPRWSDVLAIVKPATVIAWHRRGFRLYWRWRSRRRSGRPRVSEEVRNLIRKMKLENANWGAPKIHGELVKLGFAVSERTVARYLRGLRPRTAKSDQRWKGLSRQSSRGDRRVRLLHCTYLDVQTAVLLLDHRAWSAKDFALQCYRSSDLGMGCAAVAGSLPRSGSIPVRHLRPRLEVQRRCSPVARSDWSKNRSARASRHLGKTELRNGGSAAAVERCWITSYR
jgi:hypothetical protein